MSPARKLGRKPRLDYFLCKLRPYYASAQSKHIGIVMLTRKPCAHDVSAKRAAYALDLICAYGNAYPRAANDYASTKLALRNGFRYRKSNIGIIDAFFAHAAHIDRRIAELGNKRHKGFFKRKASMVARNRDLQHFAHGYQPPHSSSTVKPLAFKSLFIYASPRSHVGIASANMTSASDEWSRSSAKRFRHIVLISFFVPIISYLLPL